MAAVWSVLPGAVAQPLPFHGRHVACDSAGPDRAGGKSASDDSKNARARASVRQRAESDTAFTPRRQCQGTGFGPVPPRSHLLNACRC